MRVKAKKSLGQHFLKDQGIIGEILKIAAVSKQDVILEIGPGTGALTQALSQEALKVIAIEIDRELVMRLLTQFVDSENVSILEGNILDVHLEELIAEAGLAEQGYKIVANLPYYITAPIIRTLLALKERPQSLTLMVQNEVADRLAAPAGKMSLLSVMAQYYSRVEKKLFVPKTAFDPEPEVDSAVIVLVPFRKYDAERDRAFFRIVRAGFAARRKTLANNLSSSLKVSRGKVEAVLAEHGLRTDIRAQALSIADWEQLVDHEPSLLEALEEQNA